jgi:ribosomal protein S2
MNYFFKYKKKLWENLILSKLIEGKVHLGGPTNNWNSNTNAYIFSLRQDLCLIDIRLTAIDLKHIVKFLTRLASTLSRRRFRRKKWFKRISRRRRRYFGKRAIRIWIANYVPKWARSAKKKKSKFFPNENLKVLFVGYPPARENSMISFFNEKGYYFIQTNDWLNGLIGNRTFFLHLRNELIQTVRYQDDEEKQNLLDKYQGIISLPKNLDLVVIFDHHANKEAFKEAKKLKIPIISFLSTQEDHTQIDYPVLGNFNTSNAGEIYYQLITRSMK